MSQFRGSVAVILAIALGVVLIVITLAAAFGVQVGELTKDAAIGAIGVIVGALVTYLARA